MRQLRRCLQDGTLTQAHIDFEDMRARTDIPVGDLFTVMEAWEDQSKIKRSMDIILSIEAEAATTVSLKPGCIVSDGRRDLASSLRRVAGVLNDTFINLYTVAIVFGLYTADAMHLTNILLDKDGSTCLRNVDVYI